VSKHFEGGAVAELSLDFAALPLQLDLEQKLARMARWVLQAEQRALPYSFRWRSTTTARRSATPTAPTACARWPCSARRGDEDRLDARQGRHLLLLLAALMVLAPHAAHLPLWISALAGVTLLWRAAITWRASACRRSGCWCRWRWRPWPAST
jgi:hypothetical protein